MELRPEFEHSVFAFVLYVSAVLNERAKHDAYI